MTPKAVAGVIIFITLILTSCSNVGSPEFYRQTQTVEGDLESISKPLTNLNNQSYVILMWHDQMTTNIHFGFGTADVKSRKWNAYPVEKIPQSLVGTYIGKRVKITYRVVTPLQSPLVYIETFDFVQ